MRSTSWRNAEGRRCEHCGFGLYSHYDQRRCPDDEADAKQARRSNDARLHVPEYEPEDAA